MARITIGATGEEMVEITKDGQGDGIHRQEATGMKAGVALILAIMAGTIRTPIIPTEIAIAHGEAAIVEKAVIMHGLPIKMGK